MTELAPFAECFHIASPLQWCSRQPQLHPMVILYHSISHDEINIKFSHQSLSPFIQTKIFEIRQDGRHQAGEKYFSHSNHRCYPDDRFQPPSTDPSMTQDRSDCHRNRWRNNGEKKLQCVGVIPELEELYEIH
jgi:hypothetical protein